jgi:hypothetical protein
VNTAFLVKMSALLVAAVNALVYHRVTERRMDGWSAATLPRGARVAALISIGAWAAVIVCGRLMSYTLY